MKIVTKLTSLMLKNGLFKNSLNWLNIGNNLKIRPKSNQKSSKFIKMKKILRK